MFLAIAALLIQHAISPSIARTITPSDEKIASVQPADPSSGTDAGVSASAESATTAALPDALAPTAKLAEANADSDSTTAAITAPEASSASAPAAAIVLPNPYKNMAVSVSELQAENRRKQQIWMGLGIASHAAAGFDAWSTRHAITTAGGQELNPMLKPFAGNASIYAAIQVGPALMDYAARKMMYSRHGWARHMWWVPQSASFVSSLVCGAHNLGVRPPAN